jgi:hypothetical protein
MAKVEDDGICPICGEIIQVRCTGVKRKPFVDGRRYEAICDCCFAVPKLVEYDASQGWISYDYNNPALYEVAELVKEGWDKESATRSYKAVKKLLKKHKPVVESVHGFDQPPPPPKPKKPIYEDEDFSDME